MRAITIILCLAALFATCGASAEEVEANVLSHGVTKVTAHDSHMSIQVAIKTHEVDIGKPSTGRPTVIESSCTYSRYPCSIVDQVNITVNGTKVFVPRSAFCSLADLTSAVIKADKSGLVLVLYGGDGSEAYLVRLEFDAARVKRRTVSALSEPNKPLEVTNYYEVVIGD